MKNFLRVLAGFFGAFFLLMGLRWIINPSSAAASLSMPLLDGAGLSTQIGDMGSFFVTIGAMTLIGAIKQKRHWLYAPSMLLLVAALYRVLSTVLHGAAFALPSITIEIIVGLFLIFAGSKISKES
tara:strand:- start:2177 stop:2554 length:378 start_codon:yes stop_codon:yes gene_type:complete